MKQDGTYLDRGFNQFFQRIPVNQGPYNWNDYAANNSLPQVTTQDASTMFQGIPADKITGGVLQSRNGNLKLNLDDGTLVYNDGVVDLLAIGGEDNNLTIKNSSNINILST